jgi:hypothetical protein
VPEDVRGLLGAQATSVRQLAVDRDLAPGIETLAEKTSFALVNAPATRTPGRRPRRATPSPNPARAPIVIAIEEAGTKLKEQQLLAVERHLTVTLADREVAALRSIQTRLTTAATVDEIVALGREAWNELGKASSKLDGLFRQVAASEAREGFPQPIAWAGHPDLLTSIHAAILSACIDDGDDEPTFVSITHGSHYFCPIAAGAAPRSMQRRQGDRQTRVRIGTVEADAGGDAMMRTLATALENEVVLLYGADVEAKLDAMVNLLPRQPASPTRVVVGLGSPLAAAASIDAALTVLPCVSFAGPGVRQDELVTRTHATLATSLKKQPVPVVVSGLRADLVAAQLAAAPADRDAAELRDVLAWSTWSWVGRTLFSDEFGEVRKAAYPHFMDLRDVASSEWYFERFAEIPAAYQTSALTAREPARRFHLYLSGAGGTGKSCFLRSIHDTLEKNDRDVVLPVWYKVHAPSSDWSEVETQIKREVRAALERRFGADHGLVSDEDDRKEIGKYLLDLLAKLRARKLGIEQVILFIDQLERTFESGEYPELSRLTRVSEKLVVFLRQVGVDKGVRVFIASRKQYLADFLSSFEKAEEIKLHFNVLQTLSLEKEGASFVKRIVDWANAKKLTAAEITVDAAAAQLLATQERGHPLNMMLALIQLLSRDDLPQEIDARTIEELRPWQQRFHVDEALLGKDDLDWYFFLAMAHARTEIVRREEVLWRVGLVSRELARQTAGLGPTGVLERLWLLGHLGRTMHPRPQGQDSARFLEFFHANLRDHLVTDVMNRAEDPAAGGGSRRRRGMPPAWRALDHLREIARDWEHLQQPLLHEEIRALMDHKEDFTRRVRVPGRAGEAESFYLLFMRDAEDRRDVHFQAAKECVTYSALVHGVHGRWAFRTLFSAVAQGRRRTDEFDDSQVGCCRRWLRPSRADGQSRLRILHYLVELRDVEANRLLAELVFDRGADDEPWQQLASILAEPLVAATHRSAFLTYAVQYLLDDGIPFPADNWHTERLGAFLVATCEGDRNEVTHLLETLPKEAAVLGDRRLAPALREIVDAAHVERWLGVRTTSPGPLIQRESVDGSDIELRIGAGLVPYVDRSLVERWTHDVAARLAVPVRQIALAAADAEVSTHRRTVEPSAESARTPPPGYELQLLIRGRLIGLGRFFSDRVQTLTRDWNGADAGSAIPCFNEALWEPVRWVDGRALAAASWPYPKWSFEQAATDWLQDLLRRYVATVFRYDDVFGYLNMLAETARLPRRSDLHSLANVLYPIWMVLTRLIRERAPLAARATELVPRLIEIVRESENFDVELATMKLREAMSDDLCRAFADGANQLFVLLLDPADERWLESRLNRKTVRLSFDLKPEHALRMAAAVRGRFEVVARTDHAAPVVLCSDYLRSPVFDMLQRFDPRIFVLSYSELSPSVRLTSRGVIATFAPREAAS